MVRILRRHTSWPAVALMVVEETMVTLLAVSEARKIFSQSNGCYWCARECHTG